LKRATDAFAGVPLTDAEWNQAMLPLWLGGAGLGALSDLMAAATYVASWMSSGWEAQTLAAALGRPIAQLPEEADAQDAIQILV